MSFLFFLIQCGLTIIIVIMSLSASVSLFSLFFSMTHAVPYSMSLRHTVFMGKSDDKSLLNSFWNLFLIFPPPYLIVCASVCA